MTPPDPIRVDPCSSVVKSSPAVARLRRAIFALCREKGLDDDLRHDLQLSVTGHESLTDCTAADLRAVIARLTGQAVYSPAGIMRQLASEIDNGPVRLRAFCWQRFAKEPDQLDQRQTRSAIACLRNWRKAESQNLTTDEHR